MSEETQKIEKPGEEVKGAELSVDDLEQIAGGAAAAPVRVLDKTAQALYETRVFPKASGV